ncbi:MAG TPA: glycosyltransferase family 4 protein [Firmicutes bacterium]|nr:glycosyltransferase family 4 protein [Bacillota bacterium]
MRVLVQSRPDLLRLPAGDTVQVIETIRALGALGIEVEHCTELSPYLDAFDLVHFFNISRVQETYLQCKNAVDQGKPIALTPIYWNIEEYVLNGETVQREKLLQWWRKDHALRSEVLRWADIILPNGWAEMNILSRDFAIRPSYHIVPNGVDPAFKDAGPGQFEAEYGLRDMVLCVGRISPRKNQLSLIKALNGTGLKLVLIGPINDPFYLEACRAIASGDVVFLPQMPQAKLASAYAAAKVHALPSWYDTPGLSSLEAAAAGCNVVSTNRGTAVEYFGNYAWYCDPGDIKSIREAVLAAYASPKELLLQELVLQEFTWERAARETLKAYEKILS